MTNVAVFQGRETFTLASGDRATVRARVARFLREIRAQGGEIRRAERRPDEDDGCWEVDAREGRRQVGLTGFVVLNPRD